MIVTTSISLDEEKSCSSSDISSLKRCSSVRRVEKYLAR